MKTMHLIVSDILLPAEARHDWLADLHLPGLYGLAQRVSSVQDETPPVPDVQNVPPALRALLRAWDYPVSAQHAAYAPLYMLADGLDPGEQIWHLLVPVHYALARNHVALGDIALSWHHPNEWQVLAESAGAILNENGGTLIAKHPQRWYWQHPQANGLSSAHPLQALGRNVDIWMPSGDTQAARFWRQRHNELQMIWHTHHVNEQRSTRGDPPANGLWLCGSGALPSIAHNMTYPHVDQESLILSGLRRWRKTSESTFNAPIFIDDLAQIYAQGDVAQWRNTLERLDTEYFQPLATNRCPAFLTLCGASSYRHHTIAARNWSQRWRAWRERRHVARLLQA